MRVKTIIVPTDFSPLSDEAVDFSIGLGEQLGARLVFFHSMELPQEPGNLTPMYDEGYAYNKDRIKAVLNDLVRKAKEAGIQADAETADGIPHEEVVRMAEKVKADLIVMATHGRTGLARMTMGSQAEQVVRKAPCPVLTVKGHHLQAEEG